MADLNTSYDDLRAELGDCLGFGHDPKTFNAEQVFKVEKFIKAGLRKFYTPPPQANGVVYRWTFLRPTIRIPLAASVAEVLLPPEWGGFVGTSFVLEASTTALTWGNVPLVGEGLIRERRAQSATAITGTPQMVATRPRPVDRDGQRHELLTYPVPDTAYTLSAQIVMLPARLAASNPFAYGGQDHAETIKAACLAAAELEDTDRQGGYDVAWKEQLAASIAADSKLRPTNVGYNGSRDLVHVNRNGRSGSNHAYGAIITVNGEVR